MTLKHAAQASYWILLLIVFVVLRANASHPLLNIDELIPIKISEAMQAQGRLNPNWRLADLPEFFRYDQYNFYFYNVVAHGVLRVARWIGRPDLVALRNANMVFQLAALLLATGALRRMGVRHVGLAVFAALFACAPGLVQDAGMARPESFLYLLCALFVWVLALPLSERWRMLTAGPILGAGMAVKPTFASLGLMIAFLLPLRRRPMAALAASVGALAAGTAMGFATAAPYALIHFDVFLHGIGKLSAQYNGAHPPHSLPTSTWASQGLWSARYFFELYGFVALAPLLAPFIVKGAARRWALGLAATWAALFFYFITKPVFFERNLAHALIPVLLATVLSLVALERTGWIIAVASLCVLPMAYWSVQIAAATRERDRISRFETVHALTPVQQISFGDAYGEKFPAQCDRIAVQDYNDPWSAAYVAQLAQKGFAPVAHYRSRFGALVTSTLHTYLDADVHYFRCP